MKKFLLPLVAVLLVVPLLSAEASRSRTASGEYNTMVITPQDPAPHVSGYFSNGVSFKVRSGERFATVALIDKSGQAVSFTAGMDHDGDGSADDPKSYCGETDKPIAVHPGMKLVVAAQEGLCPNGDPGIATFGTAEATFTR